MSTYSKLPRLLEHIETLESGATLCRRHGCFAEAYRWLSPYCEPSCAPGNAGGWVHLSGSPAEVNAAIRQMHSEQLGLPPALPGGDRYGLSRYALLAEYRLGYGLGMGLRPPPSSLSPFIAISAC